MITYTFFHVPGWALHWALGTKGVIPEPCPKALRGQWRTGRSALHDQKAGADGALRPLGLGRPRPTPACRDALACVESSRRTGNGERGGNNIPQVTESGAWLSFRTGEKLSVLGHRPRVGKERKRRRQARAPMVSSLLNLKTRSQRRRSQWGAAGAHLCSGRVALAGVERPDQTSKKMETNWGVVRIIQGRDVP